MSYKEWLQTGSSSYKKRGYKDAYHSTLFMKIELIYLVALTGIILN